MTNTPTDPLEEQVSRMIIECRSQDGQIDEWGERELRDDILALIHTREEQARVVTGETSDGYHTFNELYEFRLLYNAALFNEWAIYADSPEVSKSWRHSDGELCFGGGWFVVTAQLPTGQITNHYKAKDWDLFNIPEVEKAPEWDGHTPQDVAKRLRATLNKEITNE